MNYDIFIDESGLFTETSDDPGDRIIEHKRKKKFPSQLAGVIAPAGYLTPDEAIRWIKPAFEATGITISDEFHSTEIKTCGRGVFDKLIIAICKSIESSEIQPFRIVNRERVSFGDRKANYVNILAELLLRVCRRIDGKGTQSLVMNVYQAGVKNSEYEDGPKPFWVHDDFVPTIQTVFQRVAIANGWAAKSAKWKPGEFHFRSGKKDERMWLCDAISNASHDDFSSIGSDAEADLKRSLGEYDFSLSFNTTLDHVRQLADRNAYAMAIVELAEHSLSPWTSGEAKAAYARETNRIAPKLFALPPITGTPQLQLILGWLRQVAENRQDLAHAREACRWSQQHLIDKYTEQIDPTQAKWMRLSIETAALTACNHGGDTAEGRLHSERIDALVPQLAGRWEHASDLMQALVTQAVHHNDCFEHEVVVNKMSLVANYYKSLGSFFHEAYPTVFPEDVRSDLCGQALGTMIQAQTFLLLAGETRIDAARESSDEAIRQFSHELDRQRQYQYRSEIEAVGGFWESAREYLAKGIGADETDHRGLGSYIKTLEDEERGFPLLHWTRIGGLAATRGDTAEVEAFRAAWQHCGLDQSSWALGGGNHYPAHGVLRRLAAIYAVARETSKVTETLRRLQSVVSANPQTLFRVIELAAILQSAGLIGAYDRDEMNRRLIGTKKDPGVGPLLKKLLERTESAQSRIASFVSTWMELASAVENGETEPHRLVGCANIVGY